jgi:hypothetical protein
MDGGGGNDWMDGGEGDDFIVGEDGDDLLKGGPGDDELLGESGVDDLRGGLGLDFCDGGGDPGDATASREFLPWRSDCVPATERPTSEPGPQGPPSWLARPRRMVSTRERAAGLR